MRLSKDCPANKPISSSRNEYSDFPATHKDQVSLSRSWYLIYTKPRQEEVAVRNLDRQRYEVFLPKIRQVRRRHGRRMSCIEPMFPRYLFISLDTHRDNWGPIRSTIGVSNMVKFGNNPACVPKDLVEMLIKQGDESGVHRVDIEEFKAGGRIRICEGPLMGYEGIFIAKTSRDRVTVLLDIVGKQSRLFVNPSLLETLV